MHTSGGTAYARGARPAHRRHDGSRLSGRALLRFSDGRRHLFRGDGTLAGYVDELD